MRTTARLLTGTALAAAATVLSAGGAAAAFASGGTAPAALAAPCETVDTRLGTEEARTEDTGTGAIGAADADANVDEAADTAEPLGTYGVPMKCETGAAATGDTPADRNESADPHRDLDLGLDLDLHEDLSEPDGPAGADPAGDDPNGQDRGGHEQGGHDPGRHEPDGHQPEWEHGRDDPGREGHEPDGRTPRGHVNTGAGGSVAPDTTQIAAGAAVLAVAAVGGVTLLRRRASGAQGS
ncbi:hypothetical protein [Streptomyces sp. NPDC006638]|uniref:hypothetical protein n=1 Tax=Streptomyces sp. NPDC006638 TaxID=3157183 RepID=UPI0033A658F3